MRLEAKCGCGATLDLDSGGSGDCSADNRVTAALDRWNAVHANCSTLKAASMPTWRDLHIGPGHATPPGDVRGLVVPSGGIPLGD